MENLKQELLDVIETSKQVRDYLGNTKINYNDRKKELPLMSQVLNANKNITSAVCTYINIERLQKDGK